MNREIAELIKTLNGGLKHLPGLAQQMVHQYVVGHMFVGISFILIAIIIATIFIIFFKINYHKKDIDDWFSEIVVGISATIVPLFLGMVFVYRALTPIWSIISSLNS